MTDVQPELNVLALNSGSSSLKFGLYRVGSFRTEMLLSGVAELIGEKNGKFYAQDSRETALLCETVSIPSQREAIHTHRKTSRRLQNAGTGRRRASNRAWRTKAPAALSHR
jgi:acetate kinase